MRFLEGNSNGDFSLTKVFVGDDIPEYAILSHTWGANTEEVTYRDDGWYGQEQDWLPKDPVLRKTG